MFVPFAKRGLPVTEHRKLRAPREDGAVVVEPPLAQVQHWLRRSCPLDTSDLPIAGRPLHVLRLEARLAALQAARNYLEEAGQTVAVPASGRLVVAGHQPEIFHPGVWVKNFALHGLAEAHGLLPLNLVVDNDTVKSPTLSLPCWPPGHERDARSYHLKKLPLDAHATELPYEEYRIGDEAVFAGFPERAAACTTSWPYTPLVAEYWTEVQRHRERTGVLGERLAAGRRALEQRWGCANLEVPLSRLCETVPFARFAHHLLSGLARFHRLYNETVHDYRARNGLRSRNHPVPDLAAEGAWLEMPFWAWRVGARRRGRLFVQAASDRFLLRVDGEAWPSLPAAADAFVEAWQDLHRQGGKIRTRALTTTLYARLLVADTFIHGIGGGKYDELTDDLMRGFFGVQPPGYMVLSATLLLPLAPFPATLAQRRERAWLLRDLRWNPQRHLSAGTANAADEKNLLLASMKPPVGSERHRLLRRLTEELQPVVREGRQAIQAQLAGIDRELEANAILRRRDFAFCLYPGTLLRPFCEKFLYLRWD